MLYSRDGDFLFVRVKRNGNRTTTAWLSEHYRLTGLLGVGMHSCAIPEHLLGCTIFTVVRNPYTRVLNYWRWGRWRRWPFDDWVAQVVNGSKSWRRELCQKTLLAEAARRAPRINYVQIERIWEITKLKPFVGVDTSSLVKVRDWTNQHLSKFRDKKTVEVLNKIFEADFEEYGYDPDPEAALLRKRGG